MKVIRVFLYILSYVSLFSCIPEEVILHGDIKGAVTDAETSEPIEAVSIGLNPSTNNSDILSGSDGSYLFKKIEPGSYEITASKSRYGTVSKNIKVESGKTTPNDFALNLAPWPEISVSFLDFGHESTEGTFTIKNVGSGTLEYACTSSVDWIDIDQGDREVTTETDTIHISIDRSAISEEIQKEFIRIISFSDDDLYDTVRIYANGLADEDGNYYTIVTIGTQTWMAENLNTGVIKNFSGVLVLSDNDIIGKYCYDNWVGNCDTYGGLYTWDEMMDYVTIDDGVPSESDNLVFYTQGICPDGWHIPTSAEWHTLFDFVSDFGYPAILLKADSPLWTGDTDIKTDEFGFGILPGGDMISETTNLWDDLPNDERELDFYDKGVIASFWTAQTEQDFLKARAVLLEKNNAATGNWNYYRDNAASVRCIKDD